MRKRPLLLLACMFLAGIWAGAGHMWLLLPAVGIFLFYMGICRDEAVGRWLMGIALCALFLAGYFRMGSEENFRQQYLPDLYDGQELRLVGEIGRVEEKSGYICYRLTDCAIEQSGGYTACNDVLAYASFDNFEAGQILVLKGTVSLFEPAVNEGGFDAKQYYQSQKIDFSVWVDQVESVHGTKNRYRSLLTDIRRRLAESIEACNGADGVLSAMLLGQRSDLDGTVKSLYQSAGISHILAISGLHVSMLGIGLYRLLRRCRCRYLSACTLTAAFMLSYAVMTGFGVSTRRAVFMLILYLFADLMGLSYDMLSALGFVFIALLWENPFLIGYSGFVFSVVAVLGVGVTGPVLTEYRKKRDEEKEDGKITGKIADGVLLSIGISLTTLPLTAYYYYEIPVYAVFVNVVVLSIVKYLLGLGCIAALAGLWAVGAGTVLMMPCNWILSLYEWICRASLSLPGAQMITGCPHTWQLVFYYAVLGLALLGMHGRKKVSVWHIKTGLLAAGLFLVLAFREPASFEIDVLDVGQGDGIYLCTTDGVSMFIDGGSTDESNVGTYRILPFLKYKGVGRISYWFVSHTDADHISGLKEVLESGYQVDNLVFSRIMKGEKNTQELAEFAQAYGVQILYMNQGDTLVTENASMECMFPCGDAEWDGEECDGDINDLCMVLMLNDGDFKGIFTGDISSEVESELLAEGWCEQVDFYKAAHHGSKYSNSYEFLKTLNPTVAVVSCGENNRYGHPGEEAVANMEAAGARIFYTMESGRIRIGKLSNQSLSVDLYLD